MRVLFYISTLRGGGAARVLSNIANYMCNHSEVHFITNFPDENDYRLESVINRRNIEEYDGQYTGIKKNVVRIMILRNAIRELKPDICISFMGENNIRLLIAKLFLKTKTLISVRNDPNMEYRGTLSRILAKTLYKTADAVVFQTDDAKAWFPKSIQKNSKIIMNAVADEFFTTPLSSNRNGIVTFGRLSGQKNHKMLIKAFSEIADKTDENLYIYGEGELRSTLQNQIDSLCMQDRIKLMGVTKDVCGVLSKSKAFVMSSDCEGMPNALMEAMAMGVPSISTDCPCGGPNMLIEDGYNGVLVPVNDIDALAEKMKQLLLDEELCSAMGANAKASMAKLKSEVILGEWELYIRNITSCNMKS